MLPSLSAGVLQLLIHREYINLLKSIGRFCLTPANLLTFDSIQLYSLYILTKSCTSTCRCLAQIFQERGKKGKVEEISLNISLCICYKVFLTELSMVFDVWFKQRALINWFVISDRELLVTANFFSKYFIWPWVRVTHFFFFFLLKFTKCWLELFGISLAPYDYVSIYVLPLHRPPPPKCGKSETSQSLDRHRTF